MNRRFAAISARLLGATLLAALAGCATTGGPVAAFAAEGPAAPQTTQPPAPDSPVQTAAALLAAAEAAPSAEARAAYVDRLDALGVRLADGAEGGDPLAEWRSQQAAKQSGDAPWRGRALGPAYRRAVVAPGESLVIEQIFLAGQRAQIAAQVAGRGDSGAVALAISNPRAEPVCTRQVAPRASCDWLPIFTERFAIALRNTGTREASVYLVVR